MSEPAPAVKPGSAGIGWVTLAAAAVVIVLALGALLWPRHASLGPAHTLLVLDTSGSESRANGFFEALREYLGEIGEAPLGLVVARDLATFGRHLAARPDFVLAPDGLALQVPRREFLPLVVGRRPAPRNLRPQGVLVYRREAGDQPEPWRTRTAATVCGDSLSLTAAGALRRAGLKVWPRGLACGPDPYDHGPVLHALRLGAFDYAMVRQWDAERFFREGLLDPARFASRELVGPAPDLVLMVARRVPRHARLRCGEGLTALGRQQTDGSPAEQALRAGLRALDLAGFNLLLEPDFELVRKNYPSGWLLGAD